MGTSTSNPGQKGGTPLVPSWLDDEGDYDLQPQLPDRFSIPRGNFTRFINDNRLGNGGDSDHLSKATSHYVRNSLGGSSSATARLGAARRSTAQMISVFNSFLTRGISDSQRLFRLGDIIGKKAADALLMIGKFICPDGGSIDEGIARGSFIEAIIAMPELQDKNIEDLSPHEFLTFTEHYMSRVIEERLINDIGNKCFSLPDSVAQIDEIQRQLSEFIFGSVSDAVTKLNVDISHINSTQAIKIVDSIYKKSYDILAGLEE
ncbi:MAG: hypothetical protein IJA67_14660 [Oscillospiraceae bacterium]|nr:hypothetical protein [Oscillospiraceae bacterium]